MRLVAKTLLIVGLVVIASGCGEKGLGLVPVSGKVTFAGGAPPAEGVITFTPIKVQEGLPSRPGTGAFDKQGDFQVASFKPGDGLLPGTYYPKVTCWMGKPNSSDPSSFERLNYVPKDFEAPPVVVDASKGKVEIAIDVPKKK